MIRFLLGCLRGRAFVVTLVELPIVLPPAVAGSALLVVISLAILLSLELRGLWQRTPPVVGGTVGLEAK
jgi:ABC-type sulfate transport system permease component